MFSRFLAAEVGQSAVALTRDAKGSDRRALI